MTDDRFKELTVAGLDELEVYRLTMEIGENVWEIVAGWGWFEKNSMGRQFTRAADSIAANISEGYGRFSFAENRQFAYYARGSLFETGTWLRKAKKRGLIDDEKFTGLSADINLAAKMLNGYIRSIGPKDTLKEAEAPYGLPTEEEV